MKVTITSFSYKRGLPEDKTGNGGGFVFDCRAMPNPYWDESLRGCTGCDKPVDEFFDRHKEKVGRSDVFLGENGNCNKIFSIFTEIGKRPVLAFGNSMGDSGMLEFNLQNDKYRTMSFYVLCDDTERELGNLAKAEKYEKFAKERGWTTISMKKDFKTIYGDNVKREAK